MVRSATIKLAFAAFALLTAVRPAFAGKKVYVGANVAKERRVSVDRIDHRPWNAILQKYVDKDGLVNYAALRTSESGMNTLERYLQSLSTADVKAAAQRESQLAYWINAYNAVTLHGILREYPTSSIRNHTSKLGGYNIWHDYQLVVGDDAYSLDQIEHKILRKMNEPRIHFAIVCASISCPRLLNEAYTADRLAEQLDRNTKDFFARSQNFQYDSGRKQFRLSAILSWFGTDFGSKQSDQLRAIAPWLPTRAAQQAARTNSVSVKFLDYDWKLNEQPKATRTAAK